MASTNMTEGAGHSSTNRPSLHMALPLSTVIPIDSSARISLLNSMQSPLGSPRLSTSRELQRNSERPLRERSLLVESTRPESTVKAIGQAVQWQRMPVAPFLRHASTPSSDAVDEYSSYTLLACDSCLLDPTTDQGASEKFSERSSKRPKPPKVLERLRKLPNKAVQLCVGGDFVIDPRTTPMQLFDVLVWALAVVYGALVPFEVAFYDFNHYSSWRFLWFERLSDMVFTIDMVFQFFTMYFDYVTMRYIRRPRAIACRYLNTLFVFDVFANLPMDFIHFTASLSAQLAHGSFLSALFTEDVIIRTLFGFRLLRLTRITRLRTLFMHFRIRFGITSAQTQVPQFLVMCGYAAHILACIWGMTGRYGKHLGASKTWVQAVNEEKGDNVAINTPFRLYSRCIYWSVATVTGNGYGDIVPVNDIEYVVVTVGMMVAGFIWAYAIGTICGIVAALDQQRMNFEFRMDRLEVMMNEQELDVKLKRQLRRYCRHQAESVQMRQDLDLLRMMSPGLHARIAKHQIGRWLEQVPYMEEIAGSHQVIMYIRSEVCSFVCNPTEAIELPQALCQLRRGLILKACRIYCRGTVWGHHDVLLTNIDHLDKETPVALTFSEVLYLPKRAIDMLEDYYPKARKRIRRARVRSALLRYCLNLGRKQINERKGRKNVKNKYYKDAVSAAQEESTQSKLQSLQRNFESLAEQLDEAIEALADSFPAPESTSKDYRVEYVRKTSNIRDAISKITNKSRDSMRMAFWQGGFGSASGSALDLGDRLVGISSEAEGGTADDEEEDEEFLTPVYTTKIREDNGEFLPADIDEACNDGSLLRGPTDLDLIRDVSAYEVQSYGTPKFDLPGENSFHLNSTGESYAKSSAHSVTHRPGDLPIDWEGKDTLDRRLRSESKLSGSQPQSQPSSNWDKRRRSESKLSGGSQLQSQPSSNWDAKSSVVSVDVLRQMSRKYRD